MVDSNVRPCERSIANEIRSPDILTCHNMSHAILVGEPTASAWRDKRCHSHLSDSTALVHPSAARGTMVEALKHAQTCRRC